MNERELWDLKFSVEVSTLYHDWRRSTLWTVVRATRMIYLGSAVVTLVTAFSALHATAWPASIIVGVFSILIAVVSLLDLVENFSAAAQRHEQLYKRFKALQAQIERHSNETEKYLAEWNAEAQDIRVDEPPTLWAIYARAWNQAIEHHATERKGYYRKVGLWRSLLGGLIHFNPQDFPAVQA